LSVPYNRRIDGVAMNSSITAGETVQLASIICPSRKNCLACFFISKIIMYILGVMVSNMIIWAWSWTKINCSMLVEAPSCSLMFNHFVTIDSIDFFLRL
jgi:hypothetical protein